MDVETQKKIDFEELKNSRILNIISLATFVSISMLLYYGLGAFKHWKEIKKLK